MNSKLLLALLAALSLAVGTSATVAAPAESTPVPAAASIPAAAAATTGPAASAPATARARTSATRNSAVQLREHVEQTRGIGTYITLFVVLVLSGLGLPLPEEIPLLLAGYLARHETANFWILIPVGLAGALAADVILFMATQRWRSHIFRWRWMRATIRPRHLVMARRQFHDHGLKIVIVARWLPALRSAVCLTAGLTGVKFWRFLLVDATAACITVPTSILLGYYAAEHIDRLMTGIAKAEHIVLICVSIAVALALLIRFVWWRRAGRPEKLVKPLPPQNGQAAVDEKILHKPGRDTPRRSEVR